MVITRVLLLILTFSLFPFTAAAASAEGPEIVAAIPQSAARPLAPGDLPLTFSVGGIAGTLTATSPDGVYMAGGSAFVQLSLASEDDSKQGAAAELRLEAERGEIAAVSGEGVEDETEGAAAVRVAQIDGLRKGKRRNVLIEVRLNAGGGDRAPTALRIALRQKAGKAVHTIGEAAGDARDWSVALSWPVAECGTNFQAALTRIGEEGGSELRKLWRQAASPERAAPRRWLFKPDIPRRNARDDGDERPGSLPLKEVRAIYQEAAEIASAGYEPLLRRNGRYDWILSKTADDLRKYLTQEFKPAICTGAPEFAAYYEEKLAPLGRRRERLVTLAMQSERHAREMAAAAIESLRHLPGGHPGIGGASLEAMRTVDVKAGDLKALIVTLAEAGQVDPHSLADARAAADAFAALEAIAEDGMETEDLPREWRAELRAAFGAIEAALRLAAHRDRYERFWDGFYGKIQAIRAAHAEHCVCGDKIAGGPDKTEQH